MMSNLINKMRKIVLFFLCMVILTISLIAQTLNISIDNPEPRINQSINIRIDLSQIDSIISQSISDSLFELSEYDRPYINKRITPKNTGYLKLGPFEFSLNGISYKSNSIEIHVIDSIKHKTGICIRIVKNNDKQYLRK